MIAIGTRNRLREREYCPIRRICENSSWSQVQKGRVCIRHRRPLRVHDADEETSRVGVHEETEFRIVPCKFAQSGCCG
jgi:hypothetical protein